MGISQIPIDKKHVLQDMDILGGSVCFLRYSEISVRFFLDRFLARICDAFQVEIKREHDLKNFPLVCISDYVLLKEGKIIGIVEAKSGYNNLEGGLLIIASGTDIIVPTIDFAKPYMPPYSATKAHTILDSV
jgi:hypothetical protein